MRAAPGSIVAVGLLCAVLTALITLNGSVAALLPLVVVLAMRIGQPPSQMLMPLGFAGSCGALFMLTGSPVNVIVSEAAQDAGAPAFAFFSFAIVGIPLLAGTLAICVLFGPRLLPSRRPAHQAADLGRRAAAAGSSSAQRPDRGGLRGMQHGAASGGGLAHRRQMSGPDHHRGRVMVGEDGWQRRECL